MRVAVVSEFAADAVEGMAISTRQLIHGLRTVGVSVQDFSVLDDREDPRVSALKSIPRIAASRPDVVYYVPKNGLTYPSLYRAAVLRRALRAPLAVGCMQADQKVPRVAPLIRPDLVIAPSERLARSLRPAGYRVQAIHLGVDRDAFRLVGPEDGTLWRSDARPRVLHVGHLTRSRNLGVIGDLARSGHNCLVVGSPSTPADETIVRELSCAGAAVVREQIRDIAAVYRSADIYVFPVTDPRGCIETPLSVLEALACGLRVVATPFGALPEQFPSEVTFASPEDIPAAVGSALRTDRRIGTVSPIREWSQVGRDFALALSRLMAAHDRRLIVFVGLDGTGKSTQAQLLASAARERGISATTVWSRWNPLLLRPAIWFAKRVMSRGRTAAAAYDENVVRKRALFRSPSIRSVWHWLASIDHSVLALPRVLIARRRAALVIADRYYHDALVDMGVGFGADPPPARGLFRLFPKPDAVVVLDAPEEVAFGRKTDVPSIEYLRDRRPMYLRLAQQNGWAVVDAARPALDVHADVENLVWG